MRKLIISVAAMAAMMLAGCQQEMLEPASETNVVSYSVEIPEVATKATVVDDGTNINDLVYAVYKTTADKLEDVTADNMSLVYQRNPESTFFDERGTTVVEIELVNDQNYVILFWAQVNDTWVAGQDFDLRSITYPANMSANNSSLAAFANVDFLTRVDAPGKKDIDLYRPFAQINIGTKLAENYDVVLEKSYVKVVKAGEKFNMLTQKAEGTKDVEFALAEVPSDNLTVNNTPYKYAAMNYVFANGTVVVTYDIQTKNHGTVNNTVENVPVEKNYRTNIIGNLITSTTDYSVTLDKGWGEPAKEVKVEHVSTAAELVAALNPDSGTTPVEGEEKNIKFEKDINLSDLFAALTKSSTEEPKTISIPNGLTTTIDLNGYSLTGVDEGTASFGLIKNSGNLTIANSSSKPSRIALVAKENRGWNAYSSVISNNPGGNLVVKDNVTIEHLGGTDMAYGIDNLTNGKGTSAVAVIDGATIQSPYRAIRQFLNGTEATNSLTVKAGSVIKSTGGNKSIWMQDPSKNANTGSLVVEEGAELYGNVYISATAGSTEWPVSASVAASALKNGSIVEILPNELVGYNVVLIDGVYVFEQSWSVEGEKYTAYSANGLKYIANEVNAGTFTGKTIELANDIDLRNEQWAPIGIPEEGFKNTPKIKFTGSFDGQNHTIKNLNIVVEEAKEGKAYIGFFGYAKDATIKNVTFENVNLNIACLDIDHSQGHIGAVAGSLEGTSTIENVTVKGDIKVYATQDANGASRVAVVAGGNLYGNVTMKNVHVIANEGSYLKANNNTGALAGQLQGKSVFENCSSNIDVTVNKFFAGGLIGIAPTNATFTNCHTTGDVAVVAGRAGRANDHYRVGGIAGGWADGKTNVCTLTGCTYTGEISGKNADGSVAETLDYAGYVGRGYTLTNCAGSKVVIDGVEYVQADNTTFGIYTVNGVYMINKLADFMWFANHVNNGTKYFEGETLKLANNIDLNNQEWTPIGSAYKDHGFMGNFDGNGYAIKNLNITKITKDADGYVYAGLFGVTEGVDKDNQNYIKNLTIENVTIETEGHIVAAAIAYPYYTDIDNVTVKGNIKIKGGDYTSGVLAYTRRCVNAKNLAIAGNAGSFIEGSMTVGGVISDIQMNGGLKANYSNFSASGLRVKGVMHVGGISGIIAGQTLDGATVKNVTIECDDVRRGVVAGSLGEQSTIKNIITANVTGADTVVGATYDNGSAVYANGDVYSAQ